MTAGGRRDVQGHYAGPVSRLAAAALDGFGSVAAFGLMGSITAFFIRFITGDTVDFADSRGWVRALLLLAWEFLWYWFGLATVGRSPGKIVVGLRVVRRDGGRLSGGRAAIRVVVLPFSMALALVALPGIVFGRERRAMHDVAAGSVVIYDWGDRRAQVPRMRLIGLADRGQEPADPEPD